MKTNKKNPAFFTLNAIKRSIELLNFTWDQTEWTMNMKTTYTWVENVAIYFYNGHNFC